MSLFGSNAGAKAELCLDWYLTEEGDKAIKKFFKTEKNGGGTYTVLGLKKSMRGIHHLVIPRCVSKIVGLTIGGEAPQSLESVFVGENVEEIGDGAFKGLPLVYCNLQEATGLKRIGKDAFAGTSIGELAIPPQAEAEDIGVPFVRCPKYEPNRHALSWFADNGLLFERDGTGEGGFCILKSIGLPGCKQFGMRIEDFVTEIKQISAPTVSGEKMLERNSAKLMQQILNEQARQQLYLGNGLKRIWPKAFKGFDLKKVVYGKSCPISLDASTGLDPEDMMIFPPTMSEIGEEAGMDAPSFGVVSADGLPDSERKKLGNVKFITYEEYEALEKNFEYEVRSGKLVVTGLRNWDSRVAIPDCVDELEDDVSERLWGEDADDDYAPFDASESYKQQLHAEREKAFADAQKRGADLAGFAYALGVDYMKGYGVERDLVHARALFGYVGQSDHLYADAQERLEKIVQLERAEAEAERRREALEELTRMNEEQRKEQEHEHHLEALRRALASGDRSASMWFFLLGQDYLEGRGTPVDYYQAYEMLDKVPYGSPERGRANLLKEKAKATIDEIEARQAEVREREEAIARAEARERQEAAARAEAERQAKEEAKKRAEEAAKAGTQRAASAPSDAPKAAPSEASSAASQTASAAPQTSSGTPMSEVKPSYSDFTPPHDPLDGTYASGGTRLEQHYYNEYAKFHGLAHAGNSYYYGHLAKCYLSGEGCRKNDAYARRWFAMDIKHSSLKHSDSYVSYADLCFEGRGGPQDLEAAYRYYVASDTAGYKPHVKERIDTLVRQGLCKAGSKHAIPLAKAVEEIKARITERLGKSMWFFLDATGIDYVDRYPAQESFYRKARFNLEFVADEDTFRNFSFRQAFGSYENFQRSSRSAQFERSLNDQGTSRGELYEVDTKYLSKADRDAVESLKYRDAQAQMDDEWKIDSSGKDAIRAIVKLCVRAYWDEHKGDDIIDHGHPVKGWTIHYEWKSK